MIECKKFISQPRGGFVGFATLFIEKWGVQINSCKMFQKNGHRWVSFPDQSYEKDGEKKYSPYIWFEDKKVASAFSDAAVKAIDDFCSQQSPPMPNEVESIAKAQNSPEFEEDIPF